MLYALAKQGRNLGAYKVARHAFDKLQSLKVRCCVGVGVGVGVGAGGSVLSVCQRTPLIGAAAGCVPRAH